MRCLILLLPFFSLAAVLAWAPAAAQDSGMTKMRFLATGSKARVAAPPSKPYDVVAATMPQGPEDESFGLFRIELAAVAKSRVYAALARIVTSQGFFWDRDFAGGFDMKLAGVENLAAAVQLEHRNGAGWATLARFAAETSSAPLTGRPGIFCAPAAPEMDGDAFDRLLESTRSQMREWAFPRSETTVVRAKPQHNAAVIDAIGPALVRVLEPVDGHTTGRRSAWMRVATPSGQIGFVSPGELSPLSVERLCYGKDVFGRWRIAGYVGRGD